MHPDSRFSLFLYTSPSTWIYPGIILLVVLWLLPVASFAYDGQKPIELESDQLEVDNEKGILTYKGNVRLSQGVFTLEAEQLTVFTSDRKVARIEASGQPVKLQDRQEDGKMVEAKALHMIYDVISETIKLEGKGFLNHDGNIMHSESIFYNLKTSDLKAGDKETGKRVIMTLQPKKPDSSE